MNLTDINMASVFEKLNELGQLNSAFGQPVKLDTLTVLPVASVKITIKGEGSGQGAGEGTGGIKLKTGLPGGNGSGGGSGSGEIQIEVNPSGYIYEKDGRPVFEQVNV